MKLNMSFKEKFPSLEKKDYFFDGYTVFKKVGDEDWDMVEGGPERSIYCQEDIEKYTIDKALVRVYLQVLKNGIVVFIEEGLKRNTGGMSCESFLKALQKDNILLKHIEQTERELGL